MEEDMDMDMDMNMSVDNDSHPSSSSTIEDKIFKVYIMFVFVIKIFFLSTLIAIKVFKYDQSWAKHLNTYMDSIYYVCCVLLLLYMTNPIASRASKLNEFEVRLIILIFSILVLIHYNWSSLIPPSALMEDIRKSFTSSSSSSASLSITRTRMLTDNDNEEDEGDEDNDPNTLYKIGRAHV